MTAPEICAVCSCAELLGDLGVAALTARAVAAAASAYAAAIVSGGDLQTPVSVGGWLEDLACAIAEAQYALRQLEP